MPKKPSHAPKLTKKYYPFVSVCTPTFNRRPFIKTLFEMFRNQTYPKDRMEWIIVDDGTDPIRDLVDAANIPQIRYCRRDTKMPLGAKRNYMHSLANGSILVYMDDDDYYPPTRVEHAVDMLQKHRGALAAGSSEMYMYFKHIRQMWRCGPYGPNHATAGTFAFKRELLNQTRYDDQAEVAEERVFLKDYTIPFVQLDPFQTILVFAHDQNTFDKRTLMENQIGETFAPSRPEITVECFIKEPKEACIRQFFLHDIDDLLKKYAPGDPKNKPNTLKEIERLKAQYKAQEQEMQNRLAGGAQILVDRPGIGQVALKPQEIVEMIEQLRRDNVRLQQEAQQWEARFLELQRQVQGTPGNSSTFSAGEERVEHEGRVIQFLEPSKSEPAFRIPS